MRAGGKFFPEIESLRGVAALTVVAHHCFIVPVVQVVNFPTNPMTLHTIEDYFTLAAAAVFPGQAAVALFFAISGFVLGIGIPQKPIDAAVEWPGYAIRRTFRILPAMWFSILVGAGVFVALHRPVSFSTIVENFTFWSYSLNPPTWTLRIEFFLSLLLPPIAVLSSPGGKLGIAINVALQGLFWWLTATHDPTLQFAAFFHLGLLVPTAGRATIAWLAEHARVVPILVLLAIVAFCAPFPFSLFFWPNLYTQQLFAAALPSFLLVSYAAFGNGHLAALLRAPLARFFGRISYSLYALHFPVMLLFMTWEIDWLKPYPRISGEILLFAATMAVTTPLAYLAYRFIELPCNRTGRKAATIIKRIRLLRAEHPMVERP
jgi:peptidoglycan/LPS O-acetylase OafA/YrhL